MRQSCSTFILCLCAWTSAHLSAQTSSFVPVPPCRVVDTRRAAGPLGGPTMQAATTRTFPVPSSPCNIPANATAYSVNITLVPPGSVGYITAWPTGQSQPTVAALNDPLGIILGNSAIVPAGTSGAINIYATNLTDIVVDITGYFISPSSSTSTALGTGSSNTGVQNTAVGYNTLQTNTGDSNTAVGSYSLSANSSGNNNTALGASALLQNALGSSNTAMGTDALSNNAVGNDNTGLGFAALESNSTGSNNVAVGASSLWNAVSGGNNVAVGDSALYDDTLGSWNIAMGFQAGNAISTGNYNIDIGSNGTSSDSGVIRIGTSGSQATTYIAGIVNTTVAGSTVIVNSKGQLGTQTSSARFKEQIQDMGAASDALFKLRPVIFRYRSGVVDYPGALQYGLIAEEVEKVYPELVLHDQNKQPFALAYQELPSLLLNELQKQRRTIEEQQSKIAEQEEELQSLARRLSALEHVGARDQK